MLQDIIRKAKQNQEVTSEEALGKLMGVSGVTVMRWRRGHSIPTPEHAMRLAELAGIDPMPIVAEVMEASAKDSRLRAIFARIKNAVAAAATTLPALLLTIQHCILCKIVMRGSSCHSLRESPAW